MKKLGLFGIVLMATAFIAHGANAAQNCMVFACPTNSNKIGENKEYIQSSIGSNQCYSCDSDDYSFGDRECPYGAVVAQLNSSGEAVGLYACTDATGPADEWHLDNPTIICKKNSDLMKVDPRDFQNKNNAHLIYDLNGGAKSGKYTNGENKITAGGRDACVLIKCDDGYAPAADKKSCVKKTKCPTTNGSYAAVGTEIANNRCNPSNPSTGLASTAHVKSGNVCRVKCVAGGWNVTLMDNNSCEAGYIASSDKKKCIEDPSVQEERQQQQNTNKKQACENSGGTWNGSACVCDAANGLRTNNGVCVCLDENYKRAPDGKSCVLTDAAAARRKCEETEGAYWNVNHCACVDRDSIYSGGICMKNPSIERCKAARGATWDYVANACRCSDTKMDWDDVLAKCVESDEARREREAAEAAARLDAMRLTSRRNIDAAYGKVLNIRDTFKTSVWKDEDGKFNTARLVSDSVAGVVLGTAGGLITSKVIKKNQIKHGLEDIHCTIGGQTVADYGDQFEAGLR